MKSFILQTMMLNTFSYRGFCLIAILTEADSTEMVTLEIMEFIEGLRVRNFLTMNQASLLNSLLASNRYLDVK